MDGLYDPENPIFLSRPFFYPALGDPRMSGILLRILIALHCSQVQTSYPTEDDLYDSGSPGENMTDSP